MSAAVGRSYPSLVELAPVAAAAVRERQPELELLVREQVDAELTRLIPELP